MSAEIGKIKEGSYSEKKSYNVTQHPKEKENAGKEKERRPVLRTTGRPPDDHCLFFSALINSVPSEPWHGLHVRLPGTVSEHRALSSLTRLRLPVRHARGSPRL